MIRFLYTLSMYAATPIALLWLIVRGLRDRAYRDRVLERLGMTRLAFTADPIWVHAVSVGEVQAAGALVRALAAKYPQCPLVMTTATPTGAQRVGALLSGQVAHSYLPYDTPGAVARFLERVHPRIAIVMETEIWPNLFAACGRRGIPILLASARLSQKSVTRYRNVASLLRRVFARNVTIAAQSQLDAQRFVEIGASAASVSVCGNVKFDIAVPEGIAASAAALKQTFVDRPSWVAGSTHEGEEALLLDAHALIRQQSKDALLILVPRHPNRFAAVAAMLEQRGLAFVTRSSGAPLTGNTSVLLVDTLGELLTFYAAADVAFVAGSLVPIGGHNLLEPAALSKPILVGPHNFNAPDIARLFLQSGAAIEVQGVAALAQTVQRLFADANLAADMGRKAESIVKANRGAVDRVLRHVDNLLARRPCDAPANPAISNS